MADPTLDDPLSIPLLDPDFFSDIPISFEDFDFTLDDFDFPDQYPDQIDLHVSPSDSLNFDPNPSRVSADVADFFDFSLPEDDSRVYADVAGFDQPKRVSDCLSPDPASSHRSKSSGNSVKSVSLSPVSVLSNGVVDQTVKSEEGSNKSNNSSKLKNPGVKWNKSEESGAKSVIFGEELNESKNSINSGFKWKETGDLGSKSIVFHEEESNESSNSRNLGLKRKKSGDVISEKGSEEEKKKAKLVRNRESAHLSRQRKKHYVEELEDKVRAMHSTIQDLNNRISYVMAENASLRMQANGMPPPGAYPPPPMGYPWVPYMMKGSQVPLVPIPRLKPQNPAPAPKIKKNEGKSRTKKVASVSFLGLVFFVLLFGGLAPMVNLKFGEMKGGLEFNDRQKGFSSVNGSGGEIGIGNGFVSEGQFGNSSEPLVASLFVPRNDKLVKIDGNLILHSIMASEKAMATDRASGVKGSEETGLVARNNVPNIIPLTGRNRYPHPYRGQRALGGEREKLMSSNGNKIQEWFMEGLAGPMLSSGMCSEVFQFDVSPAAGAIVPAPSLSNVSSETQHLKNVTTKLVKGNRRIFHGAHVPLVGSENNFTEKPMGMDSEKDNFRGNNSLSSMVVSVLVDPREVGDGGGDGVMGTKSLSRIFVVVLIDSVKYVTYSCMLPLRGSSAHLVTT